MTQKNSGHAFSDPLAPVAFISGDFSPEARILAQNFLDNGWRVGVTDPKNIPDHSDSQCLYAEKANPSNTGELSASIIHTAETFGGIDCLVYCNIKLARYHMILDIDEEEWERVFNSCLKGFFLACKCAIPYMLGREKASILFLLPVIENTGIHEAIRAIAGEQMACLIEKELSPYSLTVKCFSIDKEEETKSWIRHLYTLPDKS